MIPLWAQNSAIIKISILPKSNKFKEYLKSSVKKLKMRSEDQEKQAKMSI